MSRRLLTLSLLALLPLAACGDDDGGDAGGQAGDTTTVPGAQGDDGATDDSDGATTGSGEITFDGTTYAFEATTCNLEEQGGDGPTIDIEVAGEGELDGEPYTVDVLRRTTTSGSVTVTVRLDLTTTPGEDRVTVFTGISSGQGEGTLEVDGDTVTGSPSGFTALGDAPDGDAELEVTCG